ncbi:MAG: hypothetical protein P8Z36_15590 [Gemmatimonadota bacterium]
MNQRSLLLGLLARALVRPRLLGVLVRSAWRFRARGWYRRPPFLPVPPLEYLEWRLHTAYGEGREPTVREMERYLRWSDAMRRGRLGTRTP